MFLLIIFFILLLFTGIPGLEASLHRSKSSIDKSIDRFDFNKTGDSNLVRHTVSNGILPLRGERPFINFQNLPPEAYYDDVILIKFKRAPYQSTSYDTNFETDNLRRFFGIPEIDHLNDKYNVTIEGNFFNFDEVKTIFKSRHEAWGFNLWYKMKIGKGYDLMQVIKEYSALQDLEYALPEFRKRLIESQILPLDNNPERKLPDKGNTRDFLPNDPYFEYQWSYKNEALYGGLAGADISVTEAWDIQHGSPQVVVAIIDGGIDISHPDLVGNIWPSIGYNFVDNTTQIEPGSHGTHVAGTVAASTNNGVGVAGVAGGNGSGNGVKLMSCQVFTSASNGGFHLAPVYAADNGAAISQNSWSYTEPNVYDIAVLDAIDYFNQHGGGTALIGGGITIFAAGNSGENAAYYPAYYSGTIAVAATTNSDVRAYYSNYGDWVDVCAPGGEMLISGWDDYNGILSTTPQSGYGFSMGTSMACPHVSGVAALIASQANGMLSPDNVKDILLYTSDNIYPNNPGLENLLGHGRINAGQALHETNAYLMGVPNPVDFSVDSVSQNSIGLSWRQTISNEVLLAYSTQPVFGNPSGSYSPGSLISGGGEVLYVGDGSSFQHLNLQAGNQYYYKLWSFVQNQYSSGVESSGTTDCAIYDNFPFIESFESDSPTISCWVQEKLSGNGVWLRSAGSYEGFSELSAFHGYYNMALFPVESAVARLISPVFNITGIPDPELSFWFAQEDLDYFYFFPNNELKIYYKASENGDWVMIYHNNQPVYKWTNVVLALPEPSNHYQIAFEGITDFDRFPNIVDLVEIRNKCAIWNGSISNSWSNAANWSTAMPSGSSNIAILNSNNPPFIDNLTEIENLVLYPESEINIGSTGKLTINGVVSDLTTNGGINLFGTNSFTSSLLHSQNGVKARWEQTVEGNDWHLFSSPMTEQQIQFTGSGSLLDEGSLFAWHEASQGWVNFYNNDYWPEWSVVNNNSDSFIPGKGYLIANTNNNTKQRIFDQQLNSGNVEVMVSVESSLLDLTQGFNLIGNPFPSSIDWSHASGWERSSLIQAAEGVYQYWLWNPEAGNYGTCFLTSTLF